MKRLPPFLKKYFWDTDFYRLDVKKHAPAIIGKILEYGDRKAVRWFTRHYSRQDVAANLCKFRFVSPKSANFWSIIYDLPRESVPCLKKRCPKTQKKHWPY